MHTTAKSRTRVHRLYRHPFLAVKTLASCSDACAVRFSVEAKVACLKSSAARAMSSSSWSSTTTGSKAGAGAVEQLLRAPLPASIACGPVELGIVSSTSEGNLNRLLTFASISILKVCWAWKYELSKL